MTKVFLLFFILILSLLQAAAQAPVNWTKEQLLAPQELATLLSSGKKRPVIISVGPGANIPHSLHIGMTNDDGNLAKLKMEVSTLSREASVVLYCGCCPFEHCPNVRPAITVLKEAGFTNYRLLNLPSNLKKDWIDKGYPVVR